MTAKIVYQNPWFEVIQDGKWHFIHEPDSPNGAVIVAQHNGSYVFVRVPRRAHAAELLEVPRGYGEPSEAAVSAAVRELREETGFNVASENFKRIGEVRPNTAVLASTLQVFACDIPADAVAGSRDNEASEVVMLTAPEVRQLVASGDITCGITLAALLLAQV